MRAQINNTLCSMCTVFTYSVDMHLELNKLQKLVFEANVAKRSHVACTNICLVHYYTEFQFLLK